MSVGWMVNLAEADTYFLEERLVTDEWDALADAVKTKALLNAYNRINISTDHTIPAAPAAAELLLLKPAQCEMAYYLIVHLFDEDHRKGIQAQGVVHAGIAKEIYDRDMLKKLPLPPIVEELLADFSDLEAMSMIPIDRDENEAMSTDVVEED